MKVTHILGLTLGLALAGSATTARADVLVREGGLAPYRGFGVGAIFGDPTALALGLRIDDNNALQLLAGWGFADPHGSRVNLSLDYQWHFIIINPNMSGAGALSPYVGLGGKIGLFEKNPEVTAGLRVPVGLSFFISGTPLEIFAEVVPGVMLAPAVDALVDGGLGLRFYL
jgi:hypothetical protein